MKKITIIILLICCSLLSKSQLVKFLDNKGTIILSNKYDSTATKIALNAKQDTLVSGTNIKTINGSSLLGSGDLTVGGSSGITVGSTTITSGTSGRVGYNNAGVYGEYPITGTGNVMLSASPTTTGTLNSDNITVSDASNITFGGGAYKIFGTAASTNLRLQGNIVSIGGDIAASRAQLQVTSGLGDMTLFSVIPGVQFVPLRIATAGNNISLEGKTYIGANATATAQLHITAGVNAVGGGQIKLENSILPTTPEIGLINFKNGLLFLDSSNSKRDTIATRDWATYNITASSIGLGNVTNESKATMFSNPTFTGTITAPAGSIATATVVNLSGTNTGDNAVNTLYSGLVSNATHTGDATGSTALTLATVNGNVGTFGNTTTIPVITVNAKGLITSVTTAAAVSIGGGLTYAQSKSLTFKFK